MPRRTFDRSTSSESNVIDMNTRKPAAKNMMPVICERIRFYRKQMGMEQKTLARMVGVTANVSGIIQLSTNAPPTAASHSFSSSLSASSSSSSTASIIRAPVRNPSIYASSIETLVSPALAIAYSASSG